ncbi:hypothetical protein [Cytobacillus horneckiae]|uniref:Uncharacterized protein n=1 Tax=Cytobacillus horneckiae TaxID=549687 RepID=A0A2N0ZMU1_9BACI|nr:hypothetical protein [Cytobacillus horneckiae]MED2940638.1 hypothetical protein [Cytobacillus horneckiae]PKG30839.1 hypothetical protein CWS20_01075 [Cytobacillus horneckiae]
MALSRWTDNSDRSMDDIMANVMNYREWIQEDKDPYNNQPLEYSVNITFEENKSINLNDIEITYNFINYSYERVRAGEENNPMRSNRIYSIDGYIVIFTDGVITQYITNRSSNDVTKTILRKINNYSKRLEITPNPITLVDDFFIWMIYKVLNHGNQSLEEESRLLIKSIIGFKGETKDRLAEVKGSGNRILNLLSTLSFLFENEDLTQINTRIEYNNETIDYKLDLFGNVDIDFKSYTGEYMFMMDVQEEEMKSKVILMTFLEVLPKILTSYGNDKESEEWTNDSRSTFFSEIGRVISAKIAEKIENQMAK